jgi:hypothetical protein
MEKPTVWEEYCNDLADKVIDDLNDNDTPANVAMSFAVGLFNIITTNMIPKLEDEQKPCDLLKDVFNSSITELIRVFDGRNEEEIVKSLKKLRVEIEGVK